MTKRVQSLKRRITSTGHFYYRVSKIITYKINSLMLFSVAIVDSGDCGRFYSWTSTLLNRGLKNRPKYLFLNVFFGIFYPNINRTSAKLTLIPKPIAPYISIELPSDGGCIPCIEPDETWGERLTRCATSGRSAPNHRHTTFSDVNIWVCIHTNSTKEVLKYCRKTTYIHIYS